MSEHSPLSEKITPPCLTSLLGVQKDANLLDGDARFEAINPFESYIVQAPAGSGKTALLTQRFLALLSQVAQPEQIVAMTFTKKAAAEMRDRIMGALKMGVRIKEPPEGVNDFNTWQLAQRALLQDKHHGWHLLDNPNRLRIKTIDGLNSYLVGQMPLLSKMGAPSAILKKAEPAYQEAVNLTLNTSELETDLARLLRLVNGNFNRAQTLLVTMLQKRDQWMGSVLAYTGDEARDYLEQALEHIVSQELSQQVAHLSHVRSYLEEACEQANYAVQNDQPQLDCLCGAWPLRSSLEDLEAWRTLADWLLTKDGSIRKRVTKNEGFVAGKGKAKEHKDQFLNALQSLKEAAYSQQVAESLVVLRGLPDPKYSDDQWEDLQSILSLLRVSAAYLKVVFQSMGQADFIETAQAATNALGNELEPTDLAQQLDYQIQHLLVDEFQDTSSEQYALIRKLVVGWQADDGRTLFIVGDPMQSIYRFREAEVGNFLNAWQGHLGQVRLNPIQLHVNFRSSQSVVDWVNEHFKKVFPPENQIEKGAVSYSASHSYHQNTEEADFATPAVITHWEINQPHEDEAKAVVAQITQRLKAFQLDGDDDGKRIAVLGRTRSSLTGIARLLKQQQMPFRAVELESLNERQEVQDALALSRALLHLSDRAAWIALLRSPLVGLSLNDLYAIMGEDRRQAVWSLVALCLEAENVLSEEGQQRLMPVFPILQQALSRLGSLPFSVLVRETWLQLDGPQTVEQALALENVDVFFHTLAELDGQSLDFEQLSGLMDSLYARADSSPESQRIELMTMHKSKGLEFDTVILPGLGRKPRSDDTALVTWFQFMLAEQGGGDFLEHEIEQIDTQSLERLVIAPLTKKGQDSSKLSQLLKRFESQKQTYEQGRLLYVAATRAKQQLHLFGQITIKESADSEKTFSPAINSLLETLWPCVENDFNHLIASYDFSQDNQLSLLESSEGLEGLEETGNWPKVSRLPVDRKRIYGTQKENNPSSRTEKDKSNFTDKNMLDSHALLNTSVGNLVHAVLEQVVQEGIQNWPELPQEIKQKLAERQPFYQQWLEQQGLKEPELSQAIVSVLRSLNHALGNTNMRWALDHQLGESAVEYPLTSVNEEGEVSHHIVDRTFIDSDGTRWIIDYKTSVFDEHKTDNKGGEKITREQFIEYQITQYQPQLARYGELFSQLEDRPQKWVLYFSYLDGWVEVGE